MLYKKILIARLVDTVDVLQQSVCAIEQGSTVLAKPISNGWMDSWIAIQNTTRSINKHRTERHWFAPETVLDLERCWLDGWMDGWMDSS